MLNNVCRFSVTSILQGVGLPYLHWLRSTLGASLGRMTTSQFCQMYVRPFTWRNRGSVTEQLMAKGETAQHVGDATWFISHTWSNAFADTLDAVLLFFEGRADAASAKLWFDAMVTSQHGSTGLSKPSSWWMSTFKDSIARIGGLLLVVDAWDNPTALRRAWLVHAVLYARTHSRVFVLTRSAADCCCVAGVCLSCMRLPARRRREGAGLQLR